MNVRILDAPVPSVEIHIRSDDYKFKFENNDFLFQIHDQLTNPNEKLYYMSAELTCGEFPVSFYNVSQSNNRINFTYDNIEHNLFVPIGNYNMGQLLSQIDKLFTSTFPVGSTPSKPTISWDSHTNKVSFQVYSQFSYSTKLSTINKLIGFIDDGYTVNSAGTLTGKSMCDIRGITNLFFHTDLFSNGFSTHTQKDNNSKNILARIPVDAGAYGTILYRPLTPHNVALPKKAFKTFRVSIRDVEGHIVDMNLMKWSCTITIRFHNRPNVPLHQQQQSFSGGKSFYSSFDNTSHLLINYIKEITEEYKNGKMDYSKLLVN